MNGIIKASITSLLVAAVLLVILSLLSAYAEKPLISVGTLIKLDADNMELDKKRNREYRNARNRQVKGLPLSRVLWVRQRNSVIYDRGAGTVNVVLLNAMLKDRIAFLRGLPLKGNAGKMLVIK